MRGWNTDGDRKWNSCDWSDTKVLAVPIALTLIVKMITTVQFLPYLAVVDDFNVWWAVVYGRVKWDWKADGDRKWKSCDWSDTKVLTASIALTLKDKMKCSAILCNFGPA
jgi:hypothetical protein